MVEAWINTRIEKAQRDKIDELVEKGRYPSRSEFLRTAIRTQLKEDIEFNGRLSNVEA